MSQLDIIEPLLTEDSQLQTSCADENSYANRNIQDEDKDPSDTLKNVRSYEILDDLILRDEEDIGSSNDGGSFQNIDTRIVKVEDKNIDSLDLIAYKCTNENIDDSNIKGQNKNQDLSEVMKDSYKDNRNILVENKDSTDVVKDEGINQNIDQSNVQNESDLFSNECPVENIDDSILQVKNGDGSPDKELNVGVAQNENSENEESDDSCEAVDKRIVKFFVKDLQKCTQDGIYYVVRNTTFCCVQLCGIIIRKVPHKENICFEVHDGSDQITCLLDKSILESTASIGVDYNDLPKEPQGVAHGCKVILSLMKHIHSKFPTEDDLYPGQIVTIEGQLSDFGDQLYLFVEEINLTDYEHYVNYLHLTLREYEAADKVRYLV